MNCHLVKKDIEALVCILIRILSSFPDLVLLNSRQEKKQKMLSMPQKICSRMMEGNVYQTGKSRAELVSKFQATLLIQKIKA